MKLSIKQLKELIQEEMKKLDEVGDRFGNETHRAATAHGDKDEEEFRALAGKLISHRGVPASLLKRIIDEIEGGHTSEEDSGAYWEKRNSMLGPNADQNRQMSAQSEWERGQIQEAHTRVKKRNK